MCLEIIYLLYMYKEDLALKTKLNMQSLVNFKKCNNYYWTEVIWDIYMSDNFAKKYC